LGRLSDNTVEFTDKDSFGLLFRLQFLPAREGLKPCRRQSRELPALFLYAAAGTECVFSLPGPPETDHPAGGRSVLDVVVNCSQPVDEAAAARCSLFCKPEFVLCVLQARARAGCKPPKPGSALQFQVKSQKKRNFSKALPGFGGLQPARPSFH